jgi:ABC-type branched-subunit amino acid transport system permease subunit
MRSDPTGAQRRRVALENWAVRSAGWPVGRLTAVAVAVLWVGIALAVLAGLLSWDAAAFLAVGAFTLAIAAAMSYDAAIDWFDPDERGLPARFQLAPARWLALERAPGLLKRVVLPACFVLGAAIGHFVWH